MVGLYVVFYAKRCIRPHIKNLACSKMKLGMAHMGNKGCCSIRFQYKDSTLTFGCAHLESGRSTELEQIRRNQLEAIITKSFVNDRGLNRNAYDWQSHDIKVIFGDLNFRNIQSLEFD